MRWPTAVAMLLVVSLAGCANIPEQSTPQAVRNAETRSPNPVALPDPKADPYTLVRDFVGEGGHPDAAKGYLAEDAAAWQGDLPPMIVEDTFNATPLPPAERRVAGDEQGNQVTVVLTVTKIGRLGVDRAFIPAQGTEEYRVLVTRKHADDPWRIKTPPPNVVLITQSNFNTSYQQVNVYFFDPEFRVIVPDLRYVTAQPIGGAPARVIKLLLDGPSDSLDGAVKTALSGIETSTNTVSDGDGAVVVNLTKLGDKSLEERQLIAAQVVLSLRGVTQARIRLLGDGHQLIADHTDWRPSDIPSYDAATKPNSDLPGLYTSPAGRVLSLRDGQAIPGQAGNGELKVLSAAQSIDGKALAVVNEAPGGVRLRIGPLGGQLPEVDLKAATLTRPTWLLGPANTAGGNEVWTVQDGVDVVRAVRTGNDTWAASQVNASELHSYGIITDLRLSRDGVRLAAVINGLVVVASVVRTKDSVSIRSPRALHRNKVVDVIGLDWRGPDALAVLTDDGNRPVVNMPIDGFTFTPYNGANLAPPITAIAAAPDREVIVTDRSGLLATAEVNQIWRSLQQVPGARPFYPG
jgi:hypothetical protein